MKEKSMKNIIFAEEFENRFTRNKADFQMT